MLTERGFPFRYGIELLSWSGLAVLFLLVQLLPLPAAQRTSVSLFLAVLGLYLFLLFHVLLPRSNYAPHIVYATLVVDVFIIGALRLSLSEALPGLELGFVILLALAAMVVDWRGVLALDLLAVLVDLSTDAPPLLGTRQLFTPAVLLNQVLEVGAFTFIGLVVLFLTQNVRHRVAESAQAALRAADMERQGRAEAERTARQWELVNAVGLQVQAKSRPAGVLQGVGAELRAHGLDCFIGLPDPTGGQVGLAYISLPSSLLNSIERLVGFSATDFHLSVADHPSLKGAIAERRAVYLPVTDALIRRAIPRISPELLGRMVQLTGLSKCMLVPLFTGNQTRGVMGVWGRDLEPADGPAIIALGQHVAVALEKARLFERESKRAAQMVLVSQVAERVVGLLDLDELLEGIPRHIVECFGFESVSILLAEPGRREVTLRSYAGPPIHGEVIGYHQSQEVGLLGLAVRTSQTVVVNDVQANSHYYSTHPAESRCRSELCVPLKQGEEILGVLDVQSTRLDAFEPGDVAAMEALAGQIAVALDKARLFSAERKRGAQLALVSAIAEQVAAILDPDLLLDQVVESIRERFGFHHVAILLVDEDAEELYLRAISGAYAGQFPRPYRQPMEAGLIGAAARTGSTVVVNDVRQDERYYCPAEQIPISGSEISVPLKRGGRVVGVLDIQTTGVNAFGASDRAAIETLASQIAIALDKARLYHDVQHRLAEAMALYRFSQALHETLEEAELGRRALGAMQSLLHYDWGEILLIREREGRLVSLAPEGSEGEPGDLKLGDGIPGWVAQTGQGVRIDNVNQDPRYPARRPETHSELCIPLQVGDRRIGVLNVESQRPGAFTSDDERLLTTFAAPLAIAIENARLYAQTKGEAEFKTALLREQSHRIKNHLSAIAGLLYLRLDDERTPRQEILSETLARVKSMAMAHTLLAESPRARVDLLELGQRIVSESVRQMVLPGQTFPFPVYGQPIDISAHQAASVALVLNELVTNAVKHGGRGASGEGSLLIERQDGQARLTLYNRGTLPAEFDSDQQGGGLGLQLVRTLVEKDLAGSLHLHPSGNGVASVVCFAPEAD